MSDGGTPTVEGEQLVVDYCGEVHRLAPESSLMFGRRAELEIDENPYLHRVVGRFVHREGLWWLQNHGSKTSIELRDRRSSARVNLPPGQQVVVPYQAFIVSFTAGPTAYELEVERVGEPLALDDIDPGGTVTIDFGKVPLSAEQHLLLVALAEQRLRTGSLGIPTNQALASRLGWTLTKFNRKLDHLCAKLAREGVRGLRGDQGVLATDRRDALVEHAVTVGLVTADDLGLLDGAA